MEIISEEVIIRLYKKVREKMNIEEKPEDVRHCDDAITGLSVLLGKPSKTILDLGIYKDNYINTLSLYLLATGKGEILEEFLKDSSIIKEVSTAILHTILELNEVIKNNLAKHYLGSHDKNEIIKRIEERKLIRTSIQEKILDYLVGPKRAYQEEIEDKDLTIFNIYKKLRKLLEEQKEEMDTANINSIAPNMTVYTKIHILPKFNFLDRYATMMKYYIDITRDENIIRLRPIAEIESEAEGKIEQLVKKTYPGKIYEIGHLNIFRSDPLRIVFKGGIELPYTNKSVWDTIE